MRAVCRADVARGRRQGVVGLRTLFAGLEEERHYCGVGSGVLEAPSGAAEARRRSGYQGAVIGCREEICVWRWRCRMRDAERVADGTATARCRLWQHSTAEQYTEEAVGASWNARRSFPSANFGPSNGLGQGRSRLEGRYARRAEMRQRAGRYAKCVGQYRETVLHTTQEHWQ